MASGSGAPGNVLEAREWIRAWRARCGKSTAQNSVMVVMDLCACMSVHLEMCGAMPQEPGEELAKGRAGTRLKRLGVYVLSFEDLQ